MLRWIVLFIGATVFLTVNASTNLTELSNNGIQKWEPKVFSGESIYTINQFKGRLALRDISNNSASGMVLKKQIYLAATAYLNWSWSVEKTLTQLDQRSKSGDDFVARIHVVIDEGLLV